MQPETGFKLVLITTASGLAIYFVFLIITSGLVRDLGFPRSRPGWFTAEVLLTGLVCSLARVFVVYSRNKSLRSLATGWYGILLAFVVYALLHVLHQLSGFYSTQFPFLSE